MANQSAESNTNRNPLMSIARFLAIVAVIVVALIAVLVVLGVLPTTILQDAAVKIVLVTVIAAAAIGLVSLLIGGNRS